MALDADYIVDRRRMRRKLAFWRVLAVLVAIAAIVALGSLLTQPAGLPGQGYIARVKVQGLIRTNQERVAALDRLGRSSAARAVVVHVDSPGGTTAGAEELYDALVRLRERKPLVVVVNGLAASGGYIAALAADHIVAQETSLVGSIGVMFQYPNVVDLLKTIGVTVESIKSSPLKAVPNGYEPTSPEAIAAVEAIVKDTYDWFRGLVQKRRQMDADLLQKVADGRVFTGRQALALRLVDALGDERAAIAWLARTKGVDAELPVRDYSLDPRLRDLPFLHVVAAGVLHMAGLGSLARRIEESGALQAMERLNLDGLLALWHPPVAN